MRYDSKCREKVQASCQIDESDRNEASVSIEIEDEMLRDK